MKSLYRILTTVAVVALAASCDLNKQPVFDDADAFAAFDNQTIKVAETAGRVEIPITIASLDPIKTSVTYSVVAEEGDGVAVEGTNFSFADNTGVINFDGKERTKSIVVDIVDMSGVYTGDFAFTIELKNAVGINIGYEKTCKVVIEDLDHPLADILGAYTATCVDYYNGPQTFTMNLSKDPVDVNLVWCDAIVPLAAGYSSLDVWGTVSEDHNTITFNLGQKPGANWGYGDMVLCTWKLTTTGFYFYDEGEIVFTKQPDGTFATDESIAFVDDMYVWQGALVYGSEQGGTVWTKK